MIETILFVADDASILDGFRRQLPKDFRLETALGPDEGLKVLETRGPFAVVVSDLQMPGMNGIQFLSRVRERTPDTVRILLTGNADLQASIEAINEGRIFRFLTKPCPAEALAIALKAGLAQYRQIVADRELWEESFWMFSRW